MSIWNSDASDFYRLAADLSAVGPKAVKPLRGVMDEIGRATADEWRDRTRERFSKADSHAKRYPDSIDHDQLLGISTIGVEVGPNLMRGKRMQGFLGPVLEFGGSHSPAYLDGLHSVETVAPRADRMIDSALGYLFDE